MLTKIPEIIQVSDLRERLAHYLRRAEKESIVVSSQRGIATNVILSGEQYNILPKAYENLWDARTLTEEWAKNQKLVPWERTRYGV